MGFPRSGSKGKCGKISLLKYLVECHMVKVWRIRGLMLLGFDLGGSQGSPSVSTGEQLYDSSSTHKGVASNVKREITVIV